MAPGMRQGYALKSGEGPSIEFRGTKMTVKLSGAASEESYSLIEMVHPSGVGPALHIHPTGAEAFYVLEGHYTIHCGERQYEAAAGDFVYVPKGLPHAYQSGVNGGKVLVLSPAGLERYFSEVAELLRVGPVTWDVEQAIAAQYGQEFLDGLRHWGQ